MENKDMCAKTEVYANRFERYVKCLFRIIKYNIFRIILNIRPIINCNYTDSFLINSNFFCSAVVNETKT